MHIGERILKTVNFPICVTITMIVMIQALSNLTIAMKCYLDDQV